ncbi:MAG TPA: helix-turn-helix domain-containing protein [Microvirga sp.]|jgi:DNA-binding IclR family transcriptional regulator|nr:helix-turn-helix domain-containing protein [Microvirga sp.]
MSEPVRRTLSVLEYFAGRPRDAFTQAQIAEACDISGATLHRIIKTLEDSGYIFRDGSRRYRCNVVFRKLIGVPAEYFDVLTRVISAIVSETAQSAEAIIVRGDAFEWYHKEEHPEMSVQIRARTGFRRGVYELDALSRLYLSEIGWPEVERRFDTEAFYRPGARHEPVSSPEARRIIEATDPHGVAYDIEGNGRGVRRFATTVRGPRGELVHILSIAEAAYPTSDESLHVAQTSAILVRRREELALCARSLAALPDAAQ